MKKLKAMKKAGSGQLQLGEGVKALYYVVRLGEWIHQYGRGVWEWVAGHGPW